MLLPSQPVYDTTTGNIVLRNKKGWFCGGELEDKYIYQDKVWIPMIDIRIEGNISNRIICKYKVGLYEGIKKGFI